MTVAPPEQEVDTIEHLDFEHEIPCENPRHDSWGAGPAVWYVRLRNPLPRCKHPTHPVVLCDPCWRHIERGGLLGFVSCAICHTLYRVPEILKEVRPLHP